MTHAKICGITSIDDAIMCAELGASAIGLNFVPSSPRFIDREAAQAIVVSLQARYPKVLIVGVVANLDLAAMMDLKASVGLGCLQLHGHEPPSDLDPLLPHAYKAVRIAARDDVDLAKSYGGEHILVDAKVDGQALGGTGTTFDWSLVADLAKTRKLTLAGGLNPENVQAAISIVQPYCVDVASGVEQPDSPRQKDRARVQAFIANAR